MLKAWLCFVGMVISLVAAIASMFFPDLWYFIPVDLLAAAVFDYSGRVYLLKEGVKLERTLPWHP